MISNKRPKQKKERIIRNKDIQDLGISPLQMQVNLCKERPDKRMAEWAKERQQYGFDSRETWNFDATLFEFLYTRLKMFDRVNNIDTQLDTVVSTVYGKSAPGHRISLQTFLNRILADLEQLLLCDELDDEEKRMELGKKILSGLSECIFAIWW